MTEPRPLQLGTLLDLPVGAWGQVDRIDGEEDLRARLTELGFTPGEWIRVVSVLPFGGALAVNLRGGTFALRRAEARSVGVREIAR